MGVFDAARLLEGFAAKLNGYQRAGGGEARGAQPQNRQQSHAVPENPGRSERRVHRRELGPDRIEEKSLRGGSGESASSFQNGTRTMNQDG